MVESIIDIKIKIEKVLDINNSKINDLIRTLVFDLKKLGIQVLDYSRIETKFKEKKNEKIWTIPKYEYNHKMPIGFNSLNFTSCFCDNYGG